MRSNGKWTTEDEILFLNNLGIWSQNSANQERRHALLLEYYRAMSLRVYWEQVDVPRLRKHCLELIGRTTTEDEILFLNNLGNWSENSAIQGKRKLLLEHCLELIGRTS